MLHLLLSVFAPPSPFPLETITPGTAAAPFHLFINVSELINIWKWAGQWEVTRQQTPSKRIPIYGKEIRYFHLYLIRIAFCLFHVSSLVFFGRLNFLLFFTMSSWRRVVCEWDSVTILLTLTLVLKIPVLVEGLPLKKKQLIIRGLCPPRHAPNLCSDVSGARCLANQRSENTAVRQL